MRDLTLIQLISEQTIPNLLPILRLRPQHFVHLWTPKTETQAKQLEEVIRILAPGSGLKTVELSEMPRMTESYEKVIEEIGAVEAGSQAVVNFTGGTKLMSIGAYAAALAKGVPSLYVHTEGACFLDGATSPQMAELLDNDWGFGSILDRLKVHILGRANGVRRITPGKPWNLYLKLAEHLFNHPDDERLTHAAVLGPAGLIPRGIEPYDAKGWLSILDKPFSVPKDVAELAIATGIARPGSLPVELLLPDATRKKLERLAGNSYLDLDQFFAAKVPLQHTIALLTGAWWEVIVCDALSKSGVARDIRWSSQVGDPRGPDVEEDVLALDGVELLYISCKRGGAGSRLLPFLDEIHSRAAMIGGRFNRRYLAVLQPPRGKVAADLRERASKLGIRLITREDVYQTGVFAH